MSNLHSADNRGESLDLFTRGEHVGGYERTGGNILLNFILTLTVSSKHFLKDDFKGFLLYQVAQNDRKIVKEIEEEGRSL